MTMQFHFLKSSQQYSTSVQVRAYFLADWEHWLGDLEHLEPMMQ